MSRNRHIWTKSAATAAVILLWSSVGAARDVASGASEAYLGMSLPLVATSARSLSRVRAFEHARAPLFASLQPMEATPAPEPPGKRLGAFGSVAISAGKLPAARKWRNVTGADYAALFTDDCARAGLAACDSALAVRLRKTHRYARDLAGEEMLGAVNTAVNVALAYGADRATWGQGDYWAPPTETAARGIGDCEDFAITKMWLLRGLGLPADALQLVVLQDTKKAVYHAVLAVHLDGQRYILDNLTPRVRTDDAFPSYMPIMSFVGDKSYIHGFEQKRTDFAGMPRDLGAVSPGEGV